MSATNNAIIQQLLMQRLGGGGQSPAGGGAAAQPTPWQASPVSPMNAASQIAQKIMLMRALQQRAPTPGSLPGAPTQINPNAAGGMQGPVPLGGAALSPNPAIPAAGVQLGWQGGNGLPAQ